MDKTNNVKCFFEDLANAIRIKTGSKYKYTPEEMGTVIEGINAENYGCFAEVMTDNTGDGFSKVKRVIVKEGVINITEKSLQNLNVEYVYLPEGVKTIGRNVFSNTNLTYIHIPETLEYVPVDAFTGTPWINNLNDGAIYLGKCLFKLKNYQWPNDGVFVLKNDTIGISSSVFSNLTELKYIPLNEGIKYIGAEAFSNSGIIEIEFPSSVTVFESGLLYNCRSLTKVKIKKASIIYSKAFSKCSSVKTYDFSECVGVPVLNSKDIFEGINENCKIIVPESSYDKWVSSVNWSEYSDYIIKDAEYFNT